MYFKKSHIAEEFQKISTDAYLLEASPVRRFYMRPFTTIYIIIWTHLMLTFSAVAFKESGILKTRKTFWGEKIRMVIPHPRFLYFFGCLGRNEISLTNFIIKNLNAGDVFIDGGASIGYYSLLASSLVEKHGSVHSFEPTRNVFLLLSQNLSSKKNVHLNSLALWNKVDSLPMINFDVRHSVYNSVVDISHLSREKIPGLNISSFKSQDVSSIDLDTYCQERNLRPSFIKLDIERAEYRALLGARTTIEYSKPIIAIEIWKGSVNDEDLEGIVKLLKELGYEFFQLTRDLELMPISSIFDIDYRLFNLVCCPKANLINESDYR